MPTVENRLAKSETNLKVLRLKYRQLDGNYRRLFAAARKADKTMRDMAYQTKAWEELHHKAAVKLEHIRTLVEVLLDDDAPNTRLEKLIEARKELKAWTRRAKQGGK